MGSLSELCRESSAKTILPDSYGLSSSSLRNSNSPTSVFLLSLLLPFQAQTLRQTVVQFACAYAVWTAVEQSHAVMKMRLCLKINNDLLSDEEQAALMERALEIYLSKWRKNVLVESGAEPPAKKQKELIEIDIIYTDSDEEDELDEDKD